MVSVRMNPLRAPAQKPLGASLPQLGITHVADSVSGPLFSHLGHFGNSDILRKGHNSNGHPGFKAVQADIAKKEGVSAKAAGAILASRTRGASAAAKRRNPRLKRVK